MRPGLLEILVCPLCKADLTLENGREDDAGEVVAGDLRCTACNEVYPIEDGIPNMLPPDLRSA